MKVEPITPIYKSTLKIDKPITYQSNVGKVILRCIRVGGTCHRGISNITNCISCNHSKKEI